jgi:hypothetical protein
MKTIETVIVLMIAIFAIVSVYYVSNEQRYTNIIIIILLMLILGFSWSIQNDLKNVIIKK